MASKRGRSRNVVKNLMLRQVCGGSLINSPLTKYKCIPLCNIQQNNAFGSGHVLLGFTKCGEYLMSYTKKLEYEQFNVIPFFSYTLYWWRFNLMEPLQEVCHISLFAGECISDHLQLLVSHTLDDRRILILGYCNFDGRTYLARQCYVTLCPSPPCTRCFIHKDDTLTDHECACNDSYAVHMKYSLFPPHPAFKPVVQLKIKDTLVLNTVNSVVAVTVPRQARHKPPDSTPGVQAVESVILTGFTNGIEENCSRNENTTMPKNETEHELCNEDSINIADDKAIDNDDKEHRGNCKETKVSHSKFSHLSKLCYKTFCNNGTEDDRDENSSSVSDDTSPIQDIQVTGTLRNTHYKLIKSVEHNSAQTECPDAEVIASGLPCIRTRVIFLDIEQYISEALKTYFRRLTSGDLKGMYSMRNYYTQIVDVCEGSQCVILQVVSLIDLQPKAGRMTRRRNCSVSFLLSWSISTGEVCTLDVSPLLDQMGKSDRQVFEESMKRVRDLRGKYFVPNRMNVLQAFTNKTTFLGKSLQCIKHPFQPLAIVLSLEDD